MSSGPTGVLGGRGLVAAMMALIGDDVQPVADHFPIGRPRRSMDDIEEYKRLYEQLHAPKTVNRRLSHGGAVARRVEANRKRNKAARASRKRNR